MYRSFTKILHKWFENDIELIQISGNDRVWVEIVSSSIINIGIFEWNMRTDGALVTAQRGADLDPGWQFVRMRCNSPEPARA